MEPKHLDSVWARQEVVNVDMRAKPPGLTFWERTIVKMSSPVWRAAIHYTLDGSEPTRVSSLFTGPFEVDPPVVIKAKGFWDGGETTVNTIDFRELGFRLHYDNWHKPLHHN